MTAGTAPDRQTHTPGAAAIFQQMSRLARENNAVNFAQGIPEPRYDAFWAQRIGEFARPGSFQYTPSAGVPELRERVAAEYGVPVDRVGITSGCTESLQSILGALRVAGRQNVLCVEPFYSMYPGMALMQGLRAHYVPMATSGEGFAFDVVALVSAMRAHPGAIVVINSPHNPTGATLDAAAWVDLVRSAHQFGCVLVVDDAYHDFVFGGHQPVLAEAVEHGLVAIAGAASKGLAATGVRVGWMVTPPELTELADDAHMYMGYCVPEFMQRATAAVWDDVRDQLSKTCSAYARRAETLVAALRGIGATVSEPGGGFFVCAKLPRQMIGEVVGGVAAAQCLTRQGGFTPLPLDAFAHPSSKVARRWLRFAVCLDDATFDRGVKRLVALGASCAGGRGQVAQ